MNINRYRIQEGKYLFHTFLKGQNFNTEVWLENKGKFKFREDGSYATYYNEDGTIDTDKEAEATNAQLKLEADVIKKDTLGRLKVALLSDPAKVFYADTDARVDLQAAIDGAGLKGLVVTMWKLAEMYDGKRIIEVTLSEIREASALALEAKGKIVGV